MYAQVNGMGLFGMNAFKVTAEIITSRGQPAFDIVGLGDAAVQESKMRIKGALSGVGISINGQRITVNLAPADVRKCGSLYDFTIIAAILSVNNIIDVDLGDCAFVGEVSLGGGLTYTNGILSMAIEAKNSGIRKLFLPAENAREASVVEDLEIYGVENIAALINHFTGKERIRREPVYRPDPALALAENFSDVKGQPLAKHALEVAAAGFHNVLLIGPPGTGKSMISKRIPSILPPMSFEESMETTGIHSISGQLDRSNPIITQRPFRAVSHTASAVGLIGGGSVPKPGEISLAHNGVLFLDELPEFDRRTLETLRQPLEDGTITISRAQGSVSYPCDIMLVAAMNPCPCGNYGNPRGTCTCTERMIQNYLGKISRPVLDRIDIQVEMPQLSFDEISGSAPGESSEEVLERVMKAREIQKERFKDTGIRSNSKIPPSLLHRMCPMDDGAKKLISGCFDKMGLSARAYDRILKVARTCADLGGSDIIRKKDIAAAINFRSLDRKYWSM
ncbi:MAG: YifB family Mg chelatase-like AAA ATPase [Eubacterium sp.]|nr:YifB family Mg chelatase-like AAA ATPase [Eubacterium sp.]